MSKTLDCMYCLAENWALQNRILSFYCTGTSRKLAWNLLKLLSSSPPGKAKNNGTSWILHPSLLWGQEETPTCSGFTLPSPPLDTSTFLFPQRARESWCLSFKAHLEKCKWEKPNLICVLGMLLTSSPAQSLSDYRWTFGNPFLRDPHCPWTHREPWVTRSYQICSVGPD